MTEKQTTYISNWIARNAYVKEEGWLERNSFDDTDIDRLWIIDEESYQMKKFLQNTIDYDNLLLEKQVLCDEATSLCSYIDDLCSFMLGSTRQKRGSSIDSFTIFLCNVNFFYLCNIKTKHDYYE